MKRLACGDLVAGCTAVVEAENEDDIVAAAGKHALEAHGMEATPAFAEAVRGAIRDVEPATPNSDRE